VFFLIRLVGIVGNILTLAVFAHVVLSYFMRYDHPVRQAVDGIVEPMLIPIRRIMPTMGGLDFSPMVLIILIQLVEQLLIQLIAQIA
jgi:YggT family protein